MKARPLALMVTALGLAALPTALAAAPVAETMPVSVSSADALPLTPRFASLLTSYRNCVLRQVDEAMLGEQQAMARDAMSACALSRGELRSQLIADVRAQQPALNPAIALDTVETGLDQLDPIIESAAVDRAHIRYARAMY